MMISVGLVLYQGWLLTSCYRQLGELAEEKEALAADWEADRHSIEECRAENERMEILMSILMVMLIVILSGSHPTEGKGKRG